MRSISLVILTLIVALSFISCQSNEQSKKGETRVDKVLTAEGQAKLTPDLVLNQLIEGNKRFTGDKLINRDYRAQVEKTASGQFPMAAVLSCVDSRVPVEIVFDQGIGDIFVGRVAGNIVDEELLGSMEFACKVAGSKVIVVMGHEHCGAVKGAIDKVEMGNLTTLLGRIDSAVELSEDYSGEKSSKNSDYVSVVAKNNVMHNIKLIRENSPILKEMEDKGEIKIIGAYYDLDDGTVTFME